MRHLTYLALTLGLSVSLPAGTTAYWRLEEGVAGNAITAALDSSGNELNQNGKGGNPTIPRMCLEPSSTILLLPPRLQILFR
jgi:hypothetical protein